MCFCAVGFIGFNTGVSVLLTLLLEKRNQEYWALLTKNNFTSNFSHSDIVILVFA